MHLSFLVALPSLSVIVDTTRDGIWRIVGREPVHFLRCSYCRNQQRPIKCLSNSKTSELKKTEFFIVFIYIYMWYR